MIIDCDECAVRGPACSDCVVTVLLAGDTGEQDEGWELDEVDRRAVQALAGAGLVPPLRLVQISTECEGSVTSGRERAG